MLAIDPGWLLSTMAQSAAALVAIVGGFLVSRLITLASERSEAERLLRDSEERLQHLKGIADRRNEEVIRIDAEDMLDGSDVRKKIVESRGEIPTAALFEFERRSGLTPDLLDRYLEPVREIVRTTFARVERMNAAELEREFDSGLPPGVDDDQPWIDLVITHVRREQRRKDPYHSLRMASTIDTSLLSAPFLVDDLARQRWDQRLRDRDQALEEYEAAGITNAALEREVERLNTPENVWRAFWTLVYFASSGLVLPLVVLAIGPAKVHWAFRAVLCLAFVSGLAALLDLFARIIRTSVPSQVSEQ